MATYRVTDDNGTRLRSRVRAPLGRGETGPVLGHRLLRVCRSSAGDLGLLGSTVSLMTHRESASVVASSADPCREADELQYALGEGPTRDSFTQGRAVLAADLTGDDRWPGFARGALSIGVGAAFAFPLRDGVGRYGAMTHYADSSRALGPAEVQQCKIYADVATELLLDSTDPTTAGAVARALDAVVDLRVEVFQAQGMAMVDLGVGLDDAMDYLRSRAFADGTTLNELAVGLVSGRLTITPLDPPGSSVDTEPGTGPGSMGPHHPDQEQ